MKEWKQGGNKELDEKVEILEIQDKSWGKEEESL